MAPTPRNPHTSKTQLLASALVPCIEDGRDHMRMCLAVVTFWPGVPLHYAGAVRARYVRYVGRARVGVCSVYARGVFRSDLVGTLKQRKIGPKGFRVNLSFGSHGQPTKLIGLHNLSLVSHSCSTESGPSISPRRTITKAPRPKEKKNGRNGRMRNEQTPQESRPQGPGPRVRPRSSPFRVASGDEQDFDTPGSALDGWAREELSASMAWRAVPTQAGREGEWRMAKRTVKGGENVEHWGERGGGEVSWRRSLVSSVSFFCLTHGERERERERVWCMRMQKVFGQ